MRAPAARGAWPVRVPALGLALGLGLAGCGGQAGDGPPGEPGASVARPAPERAPAEPGAPEVPLLLTAQAWVAPPPRGATGPLQLAVQVTPRGGPLPDGVTLERVWVIAGGQSVEVPLERVVLRAGRLEGSAAGGPALDRSRPAEVMVRLGVAAGESRYLRARLENLTSP